MATSIRQISATWQEFAPTDADGVSYATVGTETQIRWGVPVDGSKSGLGFAGTAPPTLDLDLQQEFNLAALRHYNYAVTGELIDRAVARVAVEFMDGTVLTFDIEVEVDERAGADKISVTTDFPLTISDGVTELEVLGFQFGGELVDDFETDEEVTTTAVLRARLLSSPAEESHCVPGQFTPVFNPDKCNLPSVCPIADMPIIEDCGIPTAPEAMTDCPDIDIPTFVSVPQNFGGGQGSAGCTPRITFSYEVVEVDDCNDQDFKLATFELPPCNVHVHVTFYTCKHSGIDDRGDECCWYICCNGTWSVFQGADECADTLPTAVCDDNDTILIKCPSRCEELTSTTTTAAPGQGPCADVVCGTGPCASFETEMQLAMLQDETCACEWPSRLVFDGTEAWTAVSTNCPNYSVELRCLGGEWLLYLICNGSTLVRAATVLEQVDGTCTLYTTFTEDETSGECCDGEVTILVIGRKCVPETTPPPPDCVHTDCLPSLEGTLSVSVVTTECTCTWGATAVYNLEETAWIATADDCDDAQVALFCQSGQWWIELRCGGSVIGQRATVSDTTISSSFPATSYGTCCPGATGTIEVSFTIAECATTAPPPPAGDCIEAFSCGILPTIRYRRKGTLVLEAPSSCMCDISSDIVYSDTNSQWEAELTCANGQLAIVQLYCNSGDWEITLTCGGYSAASSAVAVPAAGNIVTIAAYFSPTSFPTCCGESGELIAVTIQLEQCCRPVDMVCSWIWIEDRTYAAGGYWSTYLGTTPCPLCRCLTPPDRSGSYDGEIVDLPADCT